MNGKGAKSISQQPIGIQSVEVAMHLLQIMMHLHRPISLSDLSRASGVQPNKLHRYLVSLVRCEMVSKARSTGHYNIGAAARRLGVAAFNRFDSHEIVQGSMIELSVKTGHDAFLYIWSENGPTLVGHQSGIHPMPTVLHLGSTVPLRCSAVGHVFLAYMPKTKTRPLLQEQDTDEPQTVGAHAIQKRLETIREQKYYWSSKPVILGSAVVAVPVFGTGNELHSVLAIAVPARAVTPQLKASLIKRLTQFSSNLSTRLASA